jgi:hypothetical protein
MDAIFEDGIPTCDAIIAYITTNTVSSPVVKKEIDAGILQTLKDNRIAFLPYVCRSELRYELRADLQTLQTPEWNADNYSVILPRVVAEIWRSFLGRTVVNATQKERIARVEAELRLSELEKKQTGSVFSQGEMRDFEYIWSKLDRFEPAEFLHAQGRGDSQREISRYIFYIHIGSLLPRLSDASYYNYHAKEVRGLVWSSLQSELPDTASLSQNEFIELASVPDIVNELLMYGFLTRFYKATKVNYEISRVPVTMSRPYSLMYTEKIERFKYWLATEDKMPDEIQWKSEEEYERDS